MALTSTDLQLIADMLAKQRKSINQDLFDFMEEHIFPRFDKLEKGFKDLKNTVESLSRHQDKQDDRIDNHDKRITKLERPTS